MEAPEASTDDPLEELVAGCLEGSPEENAAALERACAEQPQHASELRQRVEALAQLGLGGAGDAARDRFPERLGDFVLRERLGGGGMGVVFRAREESLGREVALKVIRPEHLFFPRARERFRRETEAVARLQHPGIVPIYSVGEEAGVPYFAMELVDGCTLAEILAALQGRAPEGLSGADVRQAMQRIVGPRGAPSHSSEAFDAPWLTLCLRWTISVADALQHAHERGVLHRDIKPSNIAISLDGRARVIDFGLASLDDDQARLTMSGSTLGSLLYMSPEQLRGESRQATERSDVYALGVTLHEALSLQAPYHDTSPIDLRQAILEGRSDTLRSRNRAVPRDLETVCAKAMELAPSRRYASADAFGRDLRNVLERRPIEARPPTALSKTLRWIQRNPAMSTAIGLGVAAVVGLPSALLWQEKSYAREIRGALDQAVVAQREADQQRQAAQEAERNAEQERDRALEAERESTQQRDHARREALKSAQVSNLLSQLFLATSPSQARGRELMASDILDAGIERVERELGDQPDIQAELLDTIGACYTALSVYDRSEYALKRALELRLQLYGERSLQVADSYFGLAHLQRAIGDRRARESAEKAEALQLELAPDDARGRIEYVMCVALSAFTNEEAPFALAKLQEAYELLQDTPDIDPRLRGNVLSNLANGLFRSERYEDAVRVARESIELEHSLSSKPHPGLTSSLNALALSLRRLKRLEESLAVYDELLETARVLHGEDNDRYATFLLNKAALLEDLGREPEALEILQQARAVLEGSVPPAHPQRITAVGNLGGLCTRTARWAQGREAFEAVLPQMVESFGEGTMRVRLSRFYYGLCLEGVGEVDLARDELHRSLEATIAEYGDDDYRVTRIRGALAAAGSRSAERDSQTRELAEMALDLARSNPAVVTAAAAAALALGRVELRAHRDGRAIELFRDAARFGEAARPDHWSLASATLELARLGVDDPAPARAALESALHYVEGQLGPDHPESAYCRALLDAYFAR